MSCFIGTSWCQQASGTSKPLASAFLLVPATSDVSKPAWLWCQHGFGVSMACSFISDHHDFSVTGFLVSDFLVPGIYVRYSVCH
jgi:hypothetical protein